MGFTRSNGNTTELGHFANMVHESEPSEPTDASVTSRINLRSRASAFNPVSGGIRSNAQMRTSTRGTRNILETEHIQTSKKDLSVTISTKQGFKGS